MIDFAPRSQEVKKARQIRGKNKLHTLKNFTGK